MTRNTFEGGTNGTTLTAGVGGNTGGTSGDYLDTINIAVGNAITFDSAVKEEGALAMKIAAANASGSYVQWDTSLGTLSSTYYGRAYFRNDTLIDTGIGAGTTIIRGLSTGTVNWRIAYYTTSTSPQRTLQILDGGTTVWAQGTVALPLSAWHRIEFRVIKSASIGQVIVRLYLSPESNGAPDETLDSGATRNTGTGTNQIRYGYSEAMTCWFDDIALGTGTWLGPSGGSGTPVATAIASALAPGVDVVGASIAPLLKLTVPPAAMTASASSLVPATTGSFTLANTFEGGSNGTTITTGNSGGTSGNAFDSTSGTVPTFSTAHAMHGTIGLAMQGSGNVRWSSASVTGGNTTMYGRVYVFITAAPNVQTVLVGGQTPSSTIAAQFSVRVNTNRAVGTITKGSTAIASTTKLTVATWYRLEFKMVSVTSGNCTLDCRIYVGDSTTITETMTQATGTGQAGDTSIDGLMVGSTNIVTANVVFLDDLQINSTGYPGHS